MSEPVDGLQVFQSVKRVRAGLILDVVEAGCWVREENGTSVLRIFMPRMTARYQPKAGDYWVIYEDGYQSISPKAAFEAGYAPSGDEERSGS